MAFLREKVFCLALLKVGNASSEDSFSPRRFSKYKSYLRLTILQRLENSKSFFTTIKILLDTISEREKVSPKSNTAPSPATPTFITVIHAFFSELVLRHRVAGRYPYLFRLVVQYTHGQDNCSIKETLENALFFLVSLI